MNIWDKCSTIGYLGQCLRPNFLEEIGCNVGILKKVCEIVFFSVALCGFAYGQDKDPIEELKGVWQAESIEVAGMLAPEEPTKLMRFTFKEKEVLIRGNYQDEREESCKFKLDATKSPKQIDIQPATEKEPIIGIYRIVDGKLEICLRKESKERPTEFKTSKDDPKNVLVKFKREPAPK